MEFVFKKLSHHEPGKGDHDNTVIDVEELPTENIDDSKIYRTTKTIQPIIDIYCQYAGMQSPIPLKEFAATTIGNPIYAEFQYHIIESPDDFDTSTMIPFEESGDIYHLYLNTKTGEALCINGEGTVCDFMQVYAEFYPEEYHNEIYTSADEIVPFNGYAYYFIISEGGERIVYGLPNIPNSKKFYEYTNDSSSWEECDSGDRLILDVKSFPLVNIDNNKVYRIKSRAIKTDIFYISMEMPCAISDDFNVAKANGCDASIDYYIIDELPSNPIITVHDSNNGIMHYHVYLLKDSGEPYVSLDGTNWTLFGDAYGFGIYDNYYRGIISHPDDIYGLGYYTLFGAVNTDTAYAYGVSNVNKNKTFYTYNGTEWSEYGKYVVEPLIIRKNGTYTPSEGVDGYSSVVVNVTLDTSEYDQRIAELESTLDLITKNDVGLQNFLNYAILTNNNDTITLTGLSDTSITDLTIPGSVSIIGKNALKDCTNLSNVIIGDGVTQISTNAFSGCSSISEIVIPDTVTSISMGAFSGCSSLTKMSIPFVGTSKSFTSASTNAVFGAIFGNTSFDGSIETIQQYNTSTSQTVKYYIPESLRDVIVTGGNLMHGAFYACNMLQHITLDDGVTISANNIFAKCSSLKELTISGSCTNLNHYICDKCTSLHTINLKSGVTTIGNYSFRGCSSLTEINIPDTVTSIGNCAFYNCVSIKDITIPDSITSIGNEVFYGCSNLINVKLPDSTPSVGTYVFANCVSLTEITIPDSWEIIPKYTFGQCAGLHTVNINYGIKTIGESAFSGCNSLTEITIPDSVTTIASYAFSGCNSLTEITIPDSVTTIASYAFNGCSSLAKINIPIGVTTINDYTFNGCPITELIIPDSVTSISSNALNGCSYLKKLTIPFVGRNLSSSQDSTTRYSSSLFGDIFGRTSYPNSVGVYQTYAGNSSITYQIPASLTDVVITGGYLTGDVFKNCSMIKNVTIGIGVEKFINAPFTRLTLDNLFVLNKDILNLKYALLGYSTITNLHLAWAEGEVDDSEWYNYITENDTGTNIHYNYVPEEGIMVE